MKTNRFSVTPLDPNWRQTDFDVMIVSLGFEKRSRHVAELMSDRCRVKLAPGFKNQQILSYADNLGVLTSRGFKTGDIDDLDFAVWIESQVRDVRPNGPLRLLIDISSMNRTRIAHVVELISRLWPKHDCEATFTYSMATFVPPHEVSQANVHVGPVTATLAGWWNEPERPVAVIAGLGYEEGKALGAIEYLQAEQVWLLVAESEIAEFKRAVIEANASLLETARPERVLAYSVSDPYHGFVVLDSLVDGISRALNPVLLPLGPKIFSLLCVLVGSLREDVAVWRVSAGELDEAVDQEAAGPVSGLRLLLPRLMP